VLKSSSPELRPTCRASARRPPIPHVSSPEGTREQGVAHAGSPAKLSTKNAAYYVLTTAPNRSAVRLAVNPVGEPDALIGHVRLDAPATNILLGAPISITKQSQFPLPNQGRRPHTIWTAQYRKEKADDVMEFMAVRHPKIIRALKSRQDRSPHFSC
jgi:hypothetical protein